MTRDKNLKHSIRDYAKEHGLSYSIARRSLLGSPPQPPPTPSPLSTPEEFPEERIVSGLDPIPVNESVTFHFSDHTFRSVNSPLFSVAYAILTPEGKNWITLAPGESVRIAFARKTVADESGYSAFLRAKREYPTLAWNEMSGTKLGHIPTGAPSPYWLMTISGEPDGAVRLDEGKRGTGSLESALKYPGQGKTQGR